MLQGLFKGNARQQQRSRTIPSIKPLSKDSRAFLSRGRLLADGTNCCRAAAQQPPIPNAPFRRRQRNATVARYGLSLCNAVGARGLRHACVTASRPRWAALPTGIRAELGVGSLRPIRPTALRTQADARQHRRRPLRMKPRSDRVASVEAIPCKVLLAAHRRPFDPAQAPRGHNGGHYERFKATRVRDPQWQGARLADLFLCGWASNARGGPDGLQNHLAQQFDIQGHAPSGEPLQARPGARMARSLGIGNCDVGVCVGADAKTLFLSTNSMSIGRHPLRQLFRDQPSLCACARAEKRNNGGHSRANLSTAVDVERREERSLQTDFSKPHDFADLVRIL